MIHFESIHEVVPAVRPCAPSSGDRPYSAHGGSASWDLFRQEWASIRNRADQLFTIHISKSVVLFGVSLSVSS